MDVASVSGGLGSQWVSSQALQQARRDAEQAEAEARKLRTEAANATRAADQAQSEARQLRQGSGRADNEAGVARRNLAQLESDSSAQGAASAQEMSVPPALPEFPGLPPLASSPGQKTTGTLIDVVV